MAAVEEKPVRAQARWVRMSARKARLVTDHIRGRTVPEARTVLAFTPRAAAREIEKVLRSAVANAEANHGLIGDDLYVSTAFVDEGPTLKRWRARARGRAARIRKRTCHITLELAPLPSAAAREVAPRRRRRAETAPQPPEAPPAEERPKRTRKPKVETTRDMSETQPKRTRARPQAKPTAEEAES